MTLPRLSQTEFTTLIMNTRQRRGFLYIKDRIITGDITPTAIRVIKKVEKAADIMIFDRQLSTELLAVNNAKKKEKEKRNSQSNKVVQKYEEIYGYQARKQIEKDEREEERIVNIREKRLRDSQKKRYKEMIRNFLLEYKSIKLKARFERASTIIKLRLDY